MEPQDIPGKGCCIDGHPDYYRKFGFNTPEIVYEGMPQEVFFALSFDGQPPRMAP